MEVTDMVMGTDTEVDTNQLITTVLVNVDVDLTRNIRSFQPHDDHKDKIASMLYAASVLHRKRFEERRHSVSSEVPCFRNFEVLQSSSSADSRSTVSIKEDWC